MKGKVGRTSVAFLCSKWALEECGLCPSPPLLACHLPRFSRRSGHLGRRRGGGGNPESATWQVKQGSHPPVSFWVSLRSFY